MQINKIIKHVLSIHLLFVAKLFEILLVKFVFVVKETSFLN